MAETLSSTLTPFEWSVMPSGSGRYWTLAWALMREQLERLAVDGIVPRDRFGAEGTRWTPAVDLALGDPTTFAWFGGERFAPARDVRAIAAAGDAAHLVRGTVLRLEAVIPDYYWEGMGTNYWSLDGTFLDVPHLHSALEGRWGGAAVLADGLIVPADHPIVGDDSRADRLVADLQTITRDFRTTNGLPADGSGPRQGVGGGCSPRLDGADPRGGRERRVRVSEMKENGPRTGRLRSAPRGCRPGRVARGV